MNTIGNPALGDYLQYLLKGDNPGNSFLAAFLPKLIGWAMTIGVVAFFFYLVIGAIQWITSGGDKAALETAKGKITHAIIGLVLLFSVFGIIKLIEQVFCVPILSIDLGPLQINGLSRSNSTCPVYTDSRPNPLGF